MRTTGVVRTTLHKSVSSVTISYTRTWVHRRVFLLPNFGHLCPFRYLRLISSLLSAHGIAFPSEGEVSSFYVGSVSFCVSGSVLRGTNFTLRLSKYKVHLSIWVSDLSGITHASRLMVSIDSARLGRTWRGIYRGGHVQRARVNGL